MPRNAGAGSNHLIEIVENLRSPRILVLGDAILDRYIWGDAERVSQEAMLERLQDWHGDRLLVQCRYPRGMNGPNDF